MRFGTATVASADLTQMGGLVVNCIARGTGSLPGNEAWRIPLGLFYVVPSVVAGLIWFIPEVSCANHSRDCR